jgi:pyrimidine-specific ribonucleoside hydrolase
MRRIVFRIIVLISFLAVSAGAHDVGSAGKLVIDTDMGLDDAVALTLALQNRDLDISAIVFADGAAGRTNGVQNLERMLSLFNRSDIKLFAPAETTRLPAPPPFREFAEQAVAAALPDVTAEPRALPFAPGAYMAENKTVTIVALGPLTNIAAALGQEPDLKNKIAVILCAGGPDPEKNWNLRYDPAAFENVKASGVKLEFIAADDTAARKPDAWRGETLSFGLRTSIGEDFVLRMLHQPNVRQHYLERFASFSDELVVLYVADPTLFWDKKNNHVWAPNSRAALGDLFTRLIADGRQGKSRVILIPGSLPDEILQPDLCARKAGILAKNGETEWFAQLLLNELHEHLGAYSIIGVKMGLRAAELLNAPQHGMAITSYAAGQPPFSCMNDGLIVSTGCTPGRMLFKHEPAAAPQPVSAMFEYNGRRLVLSLKAEYQQRVKARFESIMATPGADEHRYWELVREFGFEIWEDWHRRDIFEVRIEAPKPVSE